MRILFKKKMGANLTLQASFVGLS